MLVIAFIQLLLSSGSASSGDPKKLLETIRESQKFLSECKVTNSDEKIAYFGKYDSYEGAIAELLHNTKIDEKFDRDAVETLKTYFSTLLPKEIINRDAYSVCGLKLKTFREQFDIKSTLGEYRLCLEDSYKKGIPESATSQLSCFEKILSL